MHYRPPVERPRGVHTNLTASYGAKQAARGTRLGMFFLSVLAFNRHAKNQFKHVVVYLFEREVLS
jgi:hypothetical protein